MYSFIAGPEKEADMAVSANKRKAMHKRYSDVFQGIWSFKGTFSLQVKEVKKLYQAKSRCVAYAL